MKTLVGSKSKMLISIVILFSILSISNSCTKTMDNMYGMGGNAGGTGNKGGPGTNEVWIQGMTFTPATITVTAGTTITWTNKDIYTHTVTSDDGISFDSGPISTGGAYGGGGIWPHTFAIAGTYLYHCMYHSTMHGTVIVK
jgi:plastocyanin